MNKLTFLAAVLLTAAFCTHCGSGAVDPATADTTDTAESTVDPCDPLMPAGCPLPWPSNLYLKADSTRKTGYTLTFGAKSLPRDSAGKYVSPEPYKRLDGYSVGSSLLMLWPEIDMTGLAAESDPSKSLDKSAAIVWLEVDDKGKVLRHIPYFAELDATETDPKLQSLLVRPTEILRDATRYVVGVRGLKNKAGVAFAPSDAFVALRDAKTAGTPLAPRQEKFDDIFAILAAEGAAKSDLLLAWDFVTNSDDAQHGAMLKMRDDALVAVGAKGPLLTIGEIRAESGDDAADIAYEITGTFHIPDFLDETSVDAAPMFRFHLGPDGKPTQKGWRDSPFWVRVPQSALKGEPHGLCAYGHGLNGEGSEVRSGYIGQSANKHKLIFFACNWYGMSSYDVAGIFQILFNMSLFPSLPERVHQGILEHVLLARAMQQQLGELPEVKKLGIVINKNELFYSGNSQGGIYGATYMALSTDVTRGHLGVPGQNYSLLLQRSKDFEDFFNIIRGVYPVTSDQVTLLAAIQLLWDTVDPVTYYRHINAQPFANTPKHEVLLDQAQGDFQVANVTNEIALRSDTNIALMAHYGKDVFGLKETAYPHMGSGLVNWNFGNPWPPQKNEPPDDKMGDPHGKPRKEMAQWQQMVHFFRTGELIDVCDGKQCAGK